MFQPIGVLSQYIFGSLLFLLSLFIIGVILLQRGKGGGLTGALGGLGGQSAFGVKAGDLFTRITAIAVLLWIFVCALACRWYRPEKLDFEADASSSMSVGAGPADLGGANPAELIENVPASNAGPLTSPIGTDPEGTSPSGTEATPVVPSQPNKQP